jgi:hypothetical protein
VTVFAMANDPQQMDIKADYVYKNAEKDFKKHEHKLQIGVEMWSLVLCTEWY